MNELFIVKEELILKTRNWTYINLSWKLHINKIIGGKLLDSLNLLIAKINDTIILG